MTFFVYLPSKYRSFISNKLPRLKEKSPRLAEFFYQSGLYPQAEHYYYVVALSPMSKKIKKQLEHGCDVAMNKVKSYRLHEVI